MFLFSNKLDLNQETHFTINAFKEMNFNKDPNVCRKHRKIINLDQNEEARANSLCALIKNKKYC